jgi:2-dehydro-3-deoxyphosphogluconate aldolase / (4S)-4-hydroxy-2-oxoglutarate aldolase
MDDVLKKIYEFGLVPVVKIEKADSALPLGKALIKGDLPVAEITFRTSAAEESIKILARELPQLLIGAGTVLTVDQVKKATGAGAKFIVSPGFNPKVVDYCIENKIPVTPGLNTPTILEMALERGLEVVKFFPAESSGGIKFLKDMAAPYGGVKFIPTGGINADNLNTYLSYNRVHACGGSWMVKDDLISSGKFDEIARLVKEAVSRLLGFEFAHLGINEESEEGAIAATNDFSQLFNFPVKIGASSVFAGTGLEVTKTPYLGKKGHIAIATNNMERAIAYLKRKSISTLPETAKEKDGRLQAVYIKKEISGFAVHLLQK